MRFVFAFGVFACCGLSGCSAFMDVQDGAKILDKEYDSYHPLKRGSRRVEDDAEFTLLSRMKTVEIPPLEDATNFYTKDLSSSNRFAVQRAKRSPAVEGSSGGLKFDGQSGGSSSSHPKSIADQLPRNPSSSGGLSFDAGNKGSKESSGDGDNNKRLFPELFGYGPYGHPGGLHHGGGGYYGGGGVPYYPNGGYHGYPGAGFGVGYPGGNIGVGYPGAGYYPGGGHGASSASAVATSSGYKPGGFGGGAGLYPGYPGGGYYGSGYPTTYPIINGGFGGVPPPGFGGFRDEKGSGGGSSKEGGSKVTAGVSSSGGKVSGGVSFE